MMKASLAAITALYRGHAYEYTVLLLSDYATSGGRTWANGEEAP